MECCISYKAVLQFLQSSVAALCVVWGFTAADG